MKIIVLGAAGHMGRTLIDCMGRNPAYELAAAVDSARTNGAISELSL